jgi:ribosomal protein S18 acetylase RimI-like enzyme
VTIPTGLAVRAATPDDADIVRTLVHEIAAHQNQSEHVTVDAARWRELLASPQVTVLIAELDNHPVGYVSAVRRLHLWSGREALALDDLYVRPGHRDRGIGLILMTQLSQWVEGLTITWGVQPDNDAAIRFYQRLGATTRTKVMCAWTATQQPT